MGTISGHLSDKPGPQRSKARGPFFTELGLRGGKRPLDGLRWGAQVFQPRLQPAILCPDRALSACADGQVTRASQQRPSLRGPSIPIRGLLAGRPGTRQPARPRPSTAPGRGESPGVCSPAPALRHGAPAAPHPRSWPRTLPQARGAGVQLCPRRQISSFLRSRFNFDSPRECSGHHSSKALNNFPGKLSSLVFFPSLKSPSSMG